MGQYLQSTVPTKRLNKPKSVFLLVVMFGNRGQEGAPFELLVAVIVMGFVLLAGIRVLDLLQWEECKGKLDNNLELVKTAIENVSQGEGQRSVGLEVPSCFPEKTSELRIIHRTERQVCAEYCPGSRVECTLLTFSSPDAGPEGYSNWKCLRVSSSLDFPGENACTDFDVSDAGDFELTRWKNDKIESGQYILIKKFNDFTGQLRICAYKRRV